MTYCANESAVIQDGQAAIYYQAKCAGPDCRMGWRWGSQPRKRFFVTYGDKPEEEWSWDPEGIAGYESAKVRIVQGDRRGFCGFAGKP